MNISVIKEIVNNEHRVALTPTGTRTLTDAGHAVQVEENAGRGAGFSDDEYIKAGAQIVPQEKAWDADIILKVKQPLESEFPYLGEQIVFTFFHLAGVTRSLTETLLNQKTTAIAYETVENEEGHLPILAPMSAIAGNMSVTIGSYYLTHFFEGKGVQLGTILGKPYGKVVIIGDGVVGRHAGRTATGIGTSVFICGRRAERADALKKEISDDMTFFLSEPDSIAHHLKNSDLVIGAVLLRGGKTPYLVSEEMVKEMQPGSVIVDVSVDQGGCVETSRPTSHADPVFVKHDVLHYGVINMPGAYPRTATRALTTASLPYVLSLADKGMEALRENQWFAKGVNTYKGYITCEPVARAHDLTAQFRDFSDIND
jgi:alanine dehydrogenase